MTSVGSQPYGASHRQLLVFGGCQNLFASSSSLLGEATAAAELDIESSTRARVALVAKADVSVPPAPRDCIEMAEGPLCLGAAESSTERRLFTAAVY